MDNLILNGYIGCKTFGIPAVTGVMGHFVVHVLPESELARVDANLDHVLLDASHEIGKCFVSNGASLDSLSDGGEFSCFAIHLIACRIKKHLKYGNN